MQNTNRIYVAEMWTNQASYKAQGLRPYYIENGKLNAILVSRCRNKWGKIFLLTADEAEKAQKNADTVQLILDTLEKQKVLYSELLESTIVNNIIKQ